MIPSLKTKPREIKERTWIFRDGKLICPVCGSIYKPEDKEAFVKVHKFCSECGSKMR